MKRRGLKPGVSYLIIYFRNAPVFKFTRSYFMS